MEAVRERKAARQQRSGETSRGNDATQLIDEEGEEVSIVIHPMKASISSSTTTTAELQEKFKSMDEALKEAEADDEDNAKPKIQKIPFMLLEDNDNFKKYLKPRVVSIGPYHAKNPNLEVTQRIKLKLAALFIKEGDIDRNLLHERIMKKIADFKGCYTEEATKDYKNEELAWMFLVDGCALLHYIIISKPEDRDGDQQKPEDRDGANQQKLEDRYEKLKKLKIKSDHITFIQQDVFLLDNQLPYDLLELLIGLRKYKPQELQKSMENFILDSINAPRELLEANRKNYQKSKERKPFHLLDLLRMTLIQSVKSDPGCRERLRTKLISFIGTKWFDRLTCKKKHVWHSSFRNIEELKAAWISFKPSETSSMRGISFDWGTLKIPPIIVDDSTEAKLLNLAAYEMCPDFQNEFEVSTYIYFMDSLIDQAQDVKELRESGILHNALGSDEEVANLFNRISKDLVPNQMYSEVRQRIQSHCDNKWTAWINQFCAEHFHSPWSVLAFIAASIALPSSIVQTGYTVEGYYKLP
ncbi:hypothetical protein EZV62_005089 [Acer yangbiense]|uniref:Uncharacterized protein n=1 Tax=Acer yangbiense TaxID=1000413 RepID=A0A5C7IMU3_9ROSI|nr:hypothetical protein EZV62_005089 [Acer yangbiense]